MQNWTDIFFSSRDGLRLYGRHYACPGSRHRPVLCLAGLTRNSRDFHDLACALMREPRAKGYVNALLQKKPTVSLPSARATRVKTDSAVRRRLTRS